MGYNADDRSREKKQGLVRKALRPGRQESEISERKVGGWGRLLRESLRL